MIRPPPTPVPQKTPIRVGELAPGAEVELGFGGDLDVVADPHLGAEGVVQGFAEREAALPAGQVLGRGDDAGLLVGVAGRADPDADQVLGLARPAASAASRIAAAIASATSAGPPLVGVGWRASPSTFALGVDDRGLDLGPAEVDAAAQAAVAGLIRRDPTRGCSGKLGRWPSSGLEAVVGEAALVRAQSAPPAPLADRPPRGPRRLLHPPSGRGRGARGARRGPPDDRRGNPARAGLLADPGARRRGSRSARAASSTATR